MARQIIGTTRLSQRVAGAQINANFAELYANSGASPYATVVGKTAGFTAADADSNTVQRVSSASAVTITLPNNLPVGWQMAVIQAGAGQVSVVAASGATVYSRSNFTKTAGQHAVLSLLVTQNANGTSALYNLSGDGAA